MSFFYIEKADTIDVSYYSIVLFVDVGLVLTMCAYNVKTANRISATIVVAF